MLHPSQSGPCSMSEQWFREQVCSCLTSFFVWQNLSAAVERGFLSFFSPGFLMGYHTLHFIACGSLWSGLHLAPCTGCLLALWGRLRGGLSPVWVLCHFREIWGAAEERDSTGLWSPLSPSITHKLCLLAMVSPAQLFCWPVVSQAGVLQWIMFEHVIALSSSNKSDWTMKPKW